MTFRSIRIVMIACAALVGCGDDKARGVTTRGVTAVPMQSVEQLNQKITQRLNAQKAAADKIALAQSEAADRVRFVEVLKEPFDKWAELYLQLPGKPPKDVTEIADKMATIRSEMSATPTTQCTFNAREKLFRGMDEVSAVMEAFLKVQEPAPEELRIRLGEAETATREGARELVACKEAR